MANSGKLQVLLLGHDLVYNLKADLRAMRKTLDTDSVSVRMIGKLGGRCSHPDSMMYDLKQALLGPNGKHYHLIILELGANDILTYEHDIATYVHCVHLMCKMCRVHAITCLQLARSEEMFRLSAGFTQDFNNKLIQQAGRYSRVTTWSHKGLNKPQGRYFDSEGVHLSRMGTEKYITSLQSAINNHVGRLQSGNFK